ncbi:MAG: hypothetical protein M5U34_19875 [Chloroflexi bacterium]|nr:hypothetical protein [Chloroflexota bacterium]
MKTRFLPFLILVVLALSLAFAPAVLADNVYVVQPGDHPLQDCRTAWRHHAGHR